jgi:hypothetical protein
MTYGLMAGATGLLVLVTLLPLCRYEAWWIRGHDFPRLQYALFALVLLGLQAGLLDNGRPATWALFAATAACLGYQAWWIWPTHRCIARRCWTSPAKGTACESWAAMC